MTPHQSHDVNNALHSLKIAISLIREGYRFDDDLAEAKIERLEKCVETLESFVETCLRKGEF